MLPSIKYILTTFEHSHLKQYGEELDDLKDICNLIQAAIEDEPPLAMREGGIIREGYNEEIDKLRAAKRDGKEWLSELQETEKERTGIKNLRIKFNKVFGYYLEVTNSYKERVPEEWTRKQTLANADLEPRCRRRR